MMIQLMKLFSILPLLTLTVLIYGSQNCDSAKLLSRDPYFEDFTTEYLNESYLDPETYDVSLIYNPDGSNGIQMTVDVLQDVPQDICLKCVVSARAFGNYIPTGLTMDVKLCQGFGPAKNYVERLVYPLGFTSCAPTKGHYYKDEFKPDLAGLNLNIISGTHLLFDITAYTPDGAEYFRCKAYLVL